LAVIVGALVASPISGASPPKPPTFAALRAKGLRAYRSKKFEEALDIFRAASALEPDDGDVLTEVALCLAQLKYDEDAIAANRAAIRLAAGASQRERRIRRAAYFNLGKLKAGRELTFAFAEDLTCHALASEAGCARTVEACGADGGNSGNRWSSHFTTARFALTRPVAKTADDDDPFHKFWSDYAGFGASREATHDETGAPFYDVTLQYEAENRKPAEGEADVLESRQESSCAVVHVDACARRLGLYCEWDVHGEDPKAKPTAAAVELSFAEESAPATARRSRGTAARAR
jgi:tetratricopeptide (TPR) repeat protein